MAKPTEEYRWAYGSSPNITTPDTPTLEGGWQYEQVPPSGWQNYHMNAVGKWIAWLESEIGDITSDEVANDSSITGATVTEALDNLNVIKKTVILRGWTDEEGDLGSANNVPVNVIISPNFGAIFSFDFGVATTLNTKHIDLKLAPGESWPSELTSLRQSRCSFPCASTGITDVDQSFNIVWFSGSSYFSIYRNGQSGSTDADITSGLMSVNLCTITMAMA